MSSVRGIREVAVATPLEKVFHVVGVSSLLGIGFLLACIIPVRDQVIRIDSVTGSEMTKDRWFGITTKTVVKPTAIEAWIVRREGKHRPTWAFLSVRSRSLVGNLISIGCGMAPPSYPLHYAGLNEAFVARASDRQIAEFVRVMRTGTDAEREKAVDVACRIALDSTW